MRLAGNEEPPFCRVQGEVVPAAEPSERNGCDLLVARRTRNGVVRECGQLPLALSMIGAMLRGKPPAYWSHLLGVLRRADLAKIRAEFPFYPHACSGLSK